MKVCFQCSIYLVKNKSKICSAVLSSFHELSKETNYKPNCHLLANLCSAILVSQDNGLRFSQSQVALLPNRLNTACGRLGTRATKEEEPGSQVALRLIW